MINVLMFGDVVARAGRTALRQALPALKEEHQPDILLCNVENLAHGKGVTKATIDELNALGFTAYTSGNHVWSKKEGISLIENSTGNILRPANYPPEVPGKGHMLIPCGAFSVLLINLIGRVFFKDHYEDPFRTFDAILKQYADHQLAAVIVDFHCEATSEKVAFAHYVDGRASLVAGTHTHVPTADARILEKGTGTITDIGMTASEDSVLGVEKEIIIDKFLHQMPKAHEPETEPPYVVNALVAHIHPQTRKTEKIAQIRQIIEKTA